MTMVTLMNELIGNTTAINIEMDKIVINYSLVYLTT